MESLPAVTDLDGGGSCLPLGVDTEAWLDDYTRACLFHSVVGHSVGVDVVEGDFGLTGFSCCDGVRVMAGDCGWRSDDLFAGSYVVGCYSAAEGCGDSAAIMVGYMA